MTLEIRRYVPGEEPAIWDVIFRSTREVNSRDYHPKLIDRWAPAGKDMGEWAVRLEGTNPFVALDSEGKIVGMAEVDFTGFIDCFYVHPQYHRLGIGSRLMETVVETAEAYCCNRLYAMVSVTAKPFFLAKGFHVAEERNNVILGYPAPNFEMAKMRGGR